MEDQKQRLIRYLDDAWAVEKALVAALDKMADDTEDSMAKSLYAEHREVTHAQEERLEARIRALGAEPTGGKGLFGTVVSKIGEVLHRPPDEYDKDTQNLMKQYGIENFEAAMYQSLYAYAHAIGDEETAVLAQEHLQQEAETATKVWSLITPSAIKPADAARETIVA